MAEKQINVQVTCGMCQEDKLVQMTMDQLNRLEKREEYIQDILPEHSLDDRELLISGTCGTCFARMFHGIE